MAMDFGQPGRGKDRMPLSEQFIQRVLDSWQMPGTPHSISDLGGAYNTNWRVITDQVDVVVRVRPSWITLERIQDVHVLIRLLHQNGIPTAVPLRDKNDKTCALIDGRMVEIYEYLPEEGNRHWSAGRWRSAFEHMGRMHRVLSAIGFHLIPPTRSNYASPILARLMLETTADRIAALPDSRNKKEAIAICDEARRIVGCIAEYWEQVKYQLPDQLVHGDFHLDNLLFNQNDQVMYTLDFDFVAWRERVYELAYALRLALPQLTEGHEGMLNKPLIETWLNAYNEYAPYPLTEIERRTLPYEMALVALFHIGNSSRGGNPLWVVLREVNYVELARYLVACPDSLIP